MSELKRVKTAKDLKDLDVAFIKKKGQSLAKNAEELIILKQILTRIGFCEDCVIKVIKDADRILESIDFAACETSRIINEKARQLSLFNQLEAIPFDGDIDELPSSMEVEGKTIEDYPIIEQPEEPKKKRGRPKKGDKA